MASASPNANTGSRPAALPTALVSLAVGIVLASVNGAAWGATARASIVQREVSAAVLRVLRGEATETEHRDVQPEARLAPPGAPRWTGRAWSPEPPRVGLIDLPPPSRR